MIKQLLALTLASFMFSACSLYQMDIQQGNFLTEADLARIQPGMSQEQVRDILGTPLLTDAFRQNRWDYIFYLKSGREADKRSGATILFDEAGRVSQVRRD